MTSFRTMIKTAIAILLFAGALMISSRAQDVVADKIAPLLGKYCCECHGKDKQKGGIELHQIKSSVDAFRNHQFLKNVAAQIEKGEMPPDNKPQPTAAEKETLIREVRLVLSRLEKGEFPRNPGRPTIRRLNKNEYNNTVRDLFGVKFLPGNEFPSDGAGGEGFDNVGDSLFMPPVLMEKYMSASRKIIDAIQGDAAAKKRVIFAVPKAKEDPKTAARTVLISYASLAFRRRLTDGDITQLLDLFDKAIKRGDPYEKALSGPFQAILLHPAFLFRIESDKDGQSEWKVDPFELATRLSYFLWASMPDRALFQLADQGKLSDPAVMREQVERMLNDPRSETISRHFAGQWLGFDDLREVSNPDMTRFPTFTPSLRIAMYRESVDFFSHVLKANRPVTDLLDADYTFLNAELASHYGITGVTGNAMQKVSLTDKQRGGVIGQAAILTTTSLPLRTSPVKRGKWILDNLLGTPPAPPPQDAGVLPADDKTPDGLSFRAQLEKHRKVASCAACHERIDPLGFGLENFDAVGRWRTKDANGKPVDSKAALPGGAAFSSPAELKKILLKSSDLFCKNLCRKLLAYALGRPLEYYDEPVINKLYETLKTNGYQLRPVIQAIAASHPFQSRSAKR